MPDLRIPDADVITTDVYVDNNFNVLNLIILMKGLANIQLSAYRVQQELFTIK